MLCLVVKACASPCIDCPRLLSAGTTTRHSPRCLNARSLDRGSCAGDDPSPRLPRHLNREERVADKRRISAPGPTCTTSAPAASSFEPARDSPRNASCTPPGIPHSFPAVKPLIVSVSATRVPSTYEKHLPRSVSA